MRNVEVVCRLVLGTVFVVALVGKTAGRSAFPAFVRSIAVMAVLPGWAVTPAAVLSEAVEAVVAVLVLVPQRSAGVAGLTLGACLLSALTAAVGLGLRRGNRAPCRCFGASSRPLGPGHIARNLALVAVCLLGLGAALVPAPFELAPTLVAGTVGLVVGLLVSAFDDLVAMVRPG